MKKTSQTYDNHGETSVKSLNHINIIIAHRRSRSRCRCTLINRTDSRRGRRSRANITTRRCTSARSAPVVIHILVEFFLRHTRPAINHCATSTAPATAPAASTARRRLARDVPIDMFRGGFGDIAATVSGVVVSPPAGGAAGFTANGTETSRVAITIRAFDAIEQTAFCLVCMIIAPSRGRVVYDIQTDGLALCVCAVVFPYCDSGVADAGVGDEGEAF